MRIQYWLRLLGNINGGTPTEWRVGVGCYITSKISRVGRNIPSIDPFGANVPFPKSRVFLIFTGGNEKEVKLFASH